MWLPAVMRGVLVGASVIVATAALADRPTFHAQVRDVMEWASLQDCQTTLSGDGYCMSLWAGYGEVLDYTLETFDASEFVYHHILCPIGADAIEVDPKASVFKLHVTVNASDCEQYARRWDEATQGWEATDGYTGHLTFNLTLRDPEANRYDIRTGVEWYLASSLRFECKRNVGDRFGYVTGEAIGRPISTAANSTAVREQCNFGLSDR